MFTKLIVLFLIISCIPDSVSAQNIDFDGNASKSITNLLDMSSSQRFGKGLVKVFSDNDGLIPVVSTKDRYGSQHYRFTPGKTRARIDYRCKNAPIDQPPWQVTVTIPTSKPEVAGHEHASQDVLYSQACKDKNGRQQCKPEPPIKYSWLVNGSPWAPSDITADMVISPMLSRDSVFSLVVNIPQYATEMITYVDFVNCGGPEVDYLDIQVPGLIELPQSSLYVSTGASKLHPFNQYGTSTTISALMGLAKQWNQDYPHANRLVYNDVSLKWGGRFDVSSNWVGSHSNHSFGVAADVSKKCVRKSNRGALILLMDKYGLDVWSEGEKIKEQNHYHIQHKQELERLIMLNFPIEKDGRMKGDVEFADELYNNNGEGIGTDTPPLPKSRLTTSCVELMKKNYPNPPFNCNEAINPTVGGPGAGITQPYCRCINLYKVTGSSAAPTVSLISERDIEPLGCGPNNAD